MDPMFACHVIAYLKVPINFTLTKLVRPHAVICRQQVWSSFLGSVDRAPDQYPCKVLMVITDI